MPFLVGISSMVFGAITSNARIIFKLVLFLSFAAALVTFSIWFISFASDVYAVIQSATSSFSTVANSVDGMGCALNILGIGEFLNSAFSIFYSAVTFWIIAVSYIMTYKLGAKAYNGLFMAVT